MAKNDVISVENNITKKDFRKVFWRSFTLLGSFNYEKVLLIYIVLNIF